MQDQQDANVTPLATLDSLIRQRAAGDPGFASMIMALGRWLMSCGAPAPSIGSTNPEQPPTAVPVAAPFVDSGPSAAEESASADRPAMLAEPKSQADESPPLPDLTRLLTNFSGAVSPKLRTPTPVPAAGLVAEARPTLQSLAPLLPRLDLKADACAWAIRREEVSVAGRGFDEVKPGYDALRHRAGSCQPCYLWMIDADASSIVGDHWRMLEGCYRACAQILRTVLAFPEAYAESPTLLRLLGEAQSSLYSAMTASGASPRWDDKDQQRLFEWCRDETRERQVYLEHLSKDHLADPTLHGGLLARAQKEHERLKNARDRQKQLQRGLNTIRYHVGQLRLDESNASHDWKRIGEGIEAVADAGAPSSYPELVDMLAAEEWITELMPAEVAERPAVADVLRYVDQRIAAAQAAANAPPSPRREPTPEVLLAREALRGRTVVIVGGDDRPHSRENIEREFELSELKWLASREHSSIEQFRAAIVHPDTALVILMIRWASHSYEDLQEICERAGKPFVRLPGGYNPSQLAHQIIEQASEQLGIWSRGT